MTKIVKYHLGLPITNEERSVSNNNRTSINLKNYFDAILGEEEPKEKEMKKDEEN